MRENIPISGGMAEWFKAAVLKIASRATGTGVRIPLPPFFLHLQKIIAYRDAYCPGSEFCILEKKC
jgi:hypothetical protein